MLEYQVRVLEEQKDLSEKINKLRTFLCDSCQLVTRDEHRRLMRQYLAMSDYLDVLAERIAAFKES